MASNRAAAACRVDFIGNFSQSSPIQDCERSPLDVHDQYTEDAPTHANNRCCEVAAPRSLACVKAIFEQVMGMAHTLRQSLLAGTWASQRRLMWWQSECSTVRQAAVHLSSQYLSSCCTPNHLPRPWQKPIQLPEGDAPPHQQIHRVVTGRSRMSAYEG